MKKIVLISFFSFISCFASKQGLSNDVVVCPNDVTNLIKAKTCVETIVKSKKGLDDLHTMAGKKGHLGNLNECEQYHTSSYFPANKEEFKELFSGATFNNCDWSAERIQCYVITQKKSCQANSSIGKLSNTVLFVVRRKYSVGYTSVPGEIITAHTK